MQKGKYSVKICGNNIKWKMEQIPLVEPIKTTWKGN